MYMKSLCVLFLKVKPMPQTNSINDRNAQLVELSKNASWSNSLSHKHYCKKNYCNRYYAIDLKLKLN